MYSATACTAASSSMQENKDSGGAVVVFHYLTGSGCLHVLWVPAKRVQIVGMPAFMEPTYTQEELLWHL